MNDKIKDKVKEKISMGIEEIKQLKDVLLAKKQGEALERASYPSLVGEALGLGNVNQRGIYAAGIILLHQRNIELLSRTYITKEQDVLDKNGDPIYEMIHAKDSDGNFLYERIPLLDKKGNVILEKGEPVMVRGAPIYKKGNKKTALVPTGDIVHGYQGTALINFVREVFQGSGSIGGKRQELTFTTVGAMGQFFPMPGGSHQPMVPEKVNLNE